MPNMSEPNPELAAQFEKDDAERKAARANRDSQMGAAGMHIYSRIKFHPGM
jgi:hypothetical protein